MPNGSSSCLTSACCPRTPVSECTTSVMSSTVSDGWCGAVPLGVISPRTSRPGGWSTSRLAAGSTPAASRPSSTTSGPCSALLTAEIPSQRPPSLTAERSSPPPESGPRAGHDGYKRRKGSKVHMAVDTPGHLLALHVTPADEQDRAQVAKAARQNRLPVSTCILLQFNSWRTHSPRLLKRSTLPSNRSSMSGLAASGPPWRPDRLAGAASSGSPRPPVSHGPPSEQA